MKNSKNLKVVIIGGVAGGATAAARIRRLDEKAEIIMLERGEYISFANCGLPYYIGGEITEKEDLSVQTPQSFKSRFNVDVRTLNEAIKINRKEKMVTVKNLADGTMYDETYDKLIVSPGADPIKPDIAGVNLSNVFTLRSINDTLKIKDYIMRNNPSHAVVVGGGFIGIEMAENLAYAKVGVSIVELSNQVLPPLDYDMACLVHKQLSAQGINVLTQTALEKIEEIQPSENADNLKFDGKLTELAANVSNTMFEEEKLGGNKLAVTAGGKKIITDMVILAIGVRAESNLIKDCGLNVNTRGGIEVSGAMQTADSDIYAVGDAVEIVDYVSGVKTMIPLAGPANKQGRIAADNVCGLNSKFDGTQGSSIIKIFDMTVACTGINEKTAKKLGIDYEKSIIMSNSHATYYPGSEGMWIKTIFNKKDGRIYGAQIVGGTGVDKRCDVFATAIRAKMTAFDLTELELCYAPPYSSAKDPVNMAGFVIENILTEKVKVFHWHDVPDLVQRDDIILLDVRNTGERKRGAVDERFLNIPLDTLRSKIDTLDKSKKVYVHCQSGLRSYLACRILSGNGFDCYNLSGGYGFYSKVVK